MQKITIENIGPIDTFFEMDLDKKLTILIGGQATGKTTIARALYYDALCDYVANTESNTSKRQIENDAVEAIRKYLHKTYNDYKITIDPPPNTYYKKQYPIYVPAGRKTIPLIFSNYTAASRINVDIFFDEFLYF